MIGRRVIRRAIISGATGVVGSALVEELIKRGVQPLVLLHPGSPRNAFLEADERILKCECSLDGLKTLRNEWGRPFDAFFHLAWEGTTGEARYDTMLQYKNVGYTLDAVKAARRMGCGLFIGVGSQAEYGETNADLKERMPTLPTTAYGAAKLAAGHLSRMYAQEYGLCHIWVRLLSVYGPHGDENSMVTSAIRSFLRKERKAFTPGEQLWDYLYSGDAAEALLLIAEKGTSGKTYVLGSGDARPIKDYARMIAKLMQTDLLAGIGDLPYPDNQVAKLCADTEDLVQDIGWLSHTTFEVGLRKTIAFERAAYLKEKRSKRDAEAGMSSEGNPEEKGEEKSEQKPEEKGEGGKAE